MKGIVFEFKPLSRDAIPAALEKAMRYRLLNEPGEAESISLDVLRTEPDNQQALVILLVALTDRFSKGYAVGVIQAQEILPRSGIPTNRPIMRGSSASAGPSPSFIARTRSSVPVGFLSSGRIRLLRP